MCDMWTDVIPGVLAALVLLVFPGLAILLSTRVTAPTALVAAPAVSLAAIAASTLVTRVLGASWGLLWVLGTTLAIAAVCAVWTWATPWGRRMPRWAPLSGAAAAQYLIGQIIALLFMVPLYLKTLVGPTTIAQRFDNAFHLNVIEAIRRTGEATPFDTGALLRGSFYPNGWHTAVALVQDLSGLELPQSVHALALATMLGLRLAAEHVAADRGPGQALPRSAAGRRPAAARLPRLPAGADGLGAGVPDHPRTRGRPGYTN